MTDTAWRNRIVGYRVVKASELKANPNNWRMHPQRQRKAMAGLLEEIGWVDTAIFNVTTQHLIDGHLRRDLDPDADIPVLDVELTEDEERLVLATLDPITGMAISDTATLNDLLMSIDVEHEDIHALMVNIAQANRLEWGKLHADFEDPGSQLEHADELREKWGTEPGQLWELNSPHFDGLTHRLMCGDSTDAEQIERLLDGRRPRLMATDPPYGVNYDPQWRVDTLGSSTQTGIVNNDDEADWTDAYAAGKADIVYVWHAALHGEIVKNSLQQCGVIIRSQIIWVKNTFAISRGHYHWQHEACWYGVRKGKTANWQGDRSQTTIWNVAARSAVAQVEDHPDAFESGHSTQKPVELFERAIRNHCAGSDVVYEPFAGSGSCLVAGERCGIAVYGNEIDPGYVAAILERFELIGFTPQLVTLPASDSVD